MSDDLKARVRAVLTDQPQTPQEVAALAGVPADDALRDALSALLSSDEADICFRQILPEVGPWRSLRELVGVAPDAIEVGFVRRVPPAPLLTADGPGRRARPLSLPQGPEEGPISDGAGSLPAGEPADEVARRLLGP